MFAFRVSLIILLAYFKNTDESDCNDAGHTFSFTKVEFSKYPFPCFIICALERSTAVVDGCIEDNNSRIIEIRSNVTILRKGAFRNLPEVTNIEMNNTGVEEIEPKAFQNIPNAHGINLDENKLRVIRSGVFSKTLFNVITLTSNNISTIEDYAFADMPELGSLYLGGNSIEEIKENWFSNTPIQWLTLARNKLKVLKIETLSKLPRLVILDLSYNHIHRVDVLPNLTKNLSIINLTGNDLIDLQFLSGISSKFVFVGSNKISYVDDKSFNTFGKANVESIFIHPNPWQCICLRNFETLMRVRGITIGVPARDVTIKWDTDHPICVEGEVKRHMCNGIAEDQFKIGREDYFKTVSYDKFVKSRSEHGLYGSQ